MRLFTAIELPEPVRRHLADVQARLKRLTLPPVSWTKETNLHVTLKFLGEVTDDRLPELCAALAPLEFGAPALELRAEALDVFPSRGSIRVIHGRIDGDVERLIDLHRSIEGQCASLGFPREDRRYRPHVTMGRPRAPLRGAWDRLQEATDDSWPGPPFEVATFSLVHSRLNPAGAVYTTVATFPDFR
jgi:2'-5' RNA ligase